MTSNKCHVCSAREVFDPKDTTHFFVRGGNVCHACKQTEIKKIYHVWRILERYEEEGAF